MTNRVANTVMLPVQEYEELKRDAERYRWLRAFQNVEPIHLYGAKLDKYIDKEMKATRDRK